MNECGPAEKSGVACDCIPLYDPGKVLYDEVHPVVVPHERLQAPDKV